jgi:small-conductance mechanosensitive channel
MKLDPGASVLSFDVIALLAIDADAVEDESKRRILKRLFRPDRFNEITVLAFVQAIDSVYKRLRYFRVSVGNSSLIDQVLEQIVDGIFYFVLLLVILCLLKYNPWTLLVSMSTLLFSTAFAIGPSLSRYIEGVLMIIGRRPFDLGDRVFIAPADNPNPFGSPSHSWFVEDLNLFCTTLRFANTNEVATVNNAAIVNSRIVNANRSPNALVTLTMYFMDSATEEQIAVFRDTVESFVQDRPRIWDSILFFRCESINQDLGMMEYSLRIRHTTSWQDCASILMNKSEVLKFGFETGKKLKINYDSPPRATWTINSFASPGEDSPADMDGALQTLSGGQTKGDSDAVKGSPSGMNARTSSLFQGKAKGMRSLENSKTRTGGQFSFNR